MGTLPVSIEFHFIWSLAIAAILGALMGLDRSVAGKHAGMRTYALVSLGSCLFTLLSTLASYDLAASFAGINPLQIAGSVVVGIGFIGTGLAVFRGEHPVELTTASGIWVVAAIGMACGFSLYVLAIASTLIALIIFSLFAKIEYSLRNSLGVPEEKGRSRKTAQK